MVLDSLAGFPKTPTRSPSAHSSGHYKYLEQEGEKTNPQKVAAGGKDIPPPFLLPAFNGWPKTEDK